MEAFEKRLGRLDFIPPYLARYKWVCIQDIAGLNAHELKSLIGNSYQLVLDKMPQKVKKKLGL